MRSQIINFRADDALVAALTEQARKAGVTVSDIIRDAVRGQVTAEDAPAPVETRIDPFVHLKAAATGDIAAQRALADAAVHMMAERSDIDPLITLSEGLVFARLAAAQGEISDQGRVIAMLCLADGLCAGQAAAEFHGEALARLAMLADQGFDAADLALPGCADDASPQVMALAKHYRTRMPESPANYSEVR